jgi:hypothetical protein
VQNETKRCRRRLVLKIGALGEGGQLNYTHTEKRQSERTFSTTSLNYSPKARKETMRTFLRHGMTLSAIGEFA